jgi:hypothetical protein
MVSLLSVPGNTPDVEYGYWEDTFRGITMWSGNMMKSYPNSSPRFAMTERLSGRVSGPREGSINPKFIC